MPEFVLNRNYTLRSLTGHSVQFKKGVPTFVPPGTMREVVSLGAERVDGPTEPAVDDDTVKLPTEPTGEDRAKLILDLFTKLIERNAREDFTAQGAPHVKAIKEHLNFKVDNKERDLLWARYQTEAAARAEAGE